MCSFFQIGHLQFVRAHHSIHDASTKMYSQPVSRTPGPYFRMGVRLVRADGILR